MEKIYHLYNLTTLDIERSYEMLNDDNLFGPIEGKSDGIEFELTEVFGPKLRTPTQLSGHTWEGN